MTTTEKLLDLIRTNPRYSEAKTHYVSIYRKSQAYGGPEEGGWWKTYYELEGSVPFATEEQAQDYINHAELLVQQLQTAENTAFRDTFVNSYRDDVDYEDNFSYGETCGADEFTVIVESERGSLDNTNEPIGHYE